MLPCTIGVDVGGTNTDAVLLRGSEVLAAAKHPTTGDVTTGLIGALRKCLMDYKNSTNGINGSCKLAIQQVNVGTTHFINAVVQRSPQLSPVAVIRLVTPPRAFSIEPFTDFPSELSRVINGGWATVHGGYEFDGIAIDSIDQAEIATKVQEFRDRGISHFAVIGSFATLNSDQEILVKNAIAKVFPTASITTSHEIGRIGFIERENATILNESLKGLCRRTAAGIRAGLESLQLKCPLYLTQNDGTICSIENAVQFPILTFASGPTNSMRGAAFVSGVKDGIVIDIGGTTADVGVLVNGFPRLSGSEMLIGGVRTNFQMPDTLSIGLGGGSLVKFAETNSQIVNIGPQSVGYRLETDSMCFGGRILTTTDVAVAAGMIPSLANDQSIKSINLTAEQQQIVLTKIQQMIEDSADRVKTSDEPTPIILVGGGSVLVPDQCSLKGSSETLKCKNYSVANAIGAALSQVAGHVDSVFKMDTAREDESRSEAIQIAKTRAIQKAVDIGAEPNGVEVTSFEEIPLSYLPGNATQIKVTAIGSMKANNQHDAIIDLSTFTAKLNDKINDVTNEEVPSLPNNDVQQEATELGYLANYPLTPNMDKQSGIWTLDEDDVECLAIGAGILGCGGGGNPYLGKLRELQLLKKGRKLQVLSFTKFNTSDEYANSAAIPVGFMGAPLTLTEKLQTGSEAEGAVLISRLLLEHQLDDLISGKQKLQESGVTYVTGKMSELPPVAFSELNPLIVMPFEIGGVNSTEPICIAGKNGSICIDGDLMGRAFPELQMLTTFIYGQRPYPTISVNDREEFHIYLDGPNDAKPVENCARKICIESGCHMAFACAPILREDLCKFVIPHSLSRAWKLGHAVQMARKNKQNTIDAVLSVENGYFACSGKITDLSRKTIGGFNKGSLQVEDQNGQLFDIDFQNENLRLRSNNKVMAITPDLICVIETETGTPVPTDLLRYGLRVSILVIAPSTMLTTTKALAVVGPKAFDYSDSDYAMRWESRENESWSLFSD